MSEFKGWRIFVDDMRPIPEGWLGARTVSEAISILAHLHVTEVSLDHDIIFPATRTCDGYQPLMHETFKGVAYYLAARPDILATARVRVHTSNAGAAETMCGIMGLDFEHTYKLFRKEDYEDGPAVREVRGAPSDGGEGAAGGGGDVQQDTELEHVPNPEEAPGVRGGYDKSQEVPMRED